MKAARIALIAFACSVPLAAPAQWMWVDKDGRKVFSDKAPPPEIAPNQIRKAPAGRMPAKDAAADAGAPAAAPAAAQATAANLPKPSGTDKALEEKKRQAEAAENEKRKAEEARIAAAKADNCNKAKVTKANYESGVRLARLNDKGEREVIDDNQRAVEIKRLNEVIARDCA